MNQRVLVTAGASGIGRETVRAFAAQGAKVFVSDIDAQGLDRLTQEIPGLATKVCDVSKREDIEQMVTLFFAPVIEPTLSTGTQALVVAALTYLAK